MRNKSRFIPFLSFYFCNYSQQKKSAKIIKPSLPRQFLVAVPKLHYKIRMFSPHFNILQIRWSSRNNESENLKSPRFKSSQTARHPNDMQYETETIYSQENAPGTSLGHRQKFKQMQALQEGSASWVSCFVGGMFHGGGNPAGSKNIFCIKGKH